MNTYLVVGPYIKNKLILIVHVLLVSSYELNYNHFLYLVGRTNKYSLQMFIL